MRPWKTLYPHNASYDGTLSACERSLKRLGTDRIDLYLLHWRGSYPFGETVEAFEELYDGIKLAAKNYKVDLVGGDMSSSHKGIIISISVLGRVNKSRICYRSSAKIPRLS